MYSQNFDVLYSAGNTNQPWLNNSTLPGWYASRSTSGNFTQYTASAGGVTSEALYILGSAGSSERALGSLSNPENIAFGVLFQNNSGIQMNSVTVSLSAEQWRRVSTSLEGHQRVKVSYRVASSINTANLFTDEYIEIPELFLLSMDTTTVGNVGINGNTVGNFATVSATFPVVLPAGDQFFMKFFDENEVNGATNTNDLILGVDDLSITFSATSVNRVTATSTYDFYAYIDQGILTDIPTPVVTYIEPLAGDLTAWSAILQNFYNRNWAALVNVYEYEVAEITCSGEKYFVLRKRNTSDYFWGTYVTADTPSNPVLVVQAPHPLIDTDTERQAAAVFELNGASVYMVAGISRCAGIASSCNGTTSVCGPSQPYHTADPPHETNSIFHLATITFAQLNSALLFVQLHGFAKSASEPHFIVSCGTLDATVKSVPDYPVMLRDAIMANDPAWDGDTWEVKIAHVDNYSNLGALDNVQGRFLNNFSGGDICSSTIDPTTVTNRFLHIEQYKSVREFVTYYSAIAGIINSVINSTPYNKSVVVNDLSDTYTENFNDELTSSIGTFRWGNNLTLPGWYAFQEITSLTSAYRTGNGTDNLSGLYSFGPAASSDRALGSFNRDDSQDIAYGLLFRNETGGQINHVTLNYNAEQWGNLSASTTHRVTLSYRIGSNLDLSSSTILNNPGFVAHPAGDMIATFNSASNGNVNFTSISNLTLDVNWNNGDELFIRFYDNNESGGADDAMAIDDFSVSFSATPLPVRWVSFDVEDFYGSPRLRWKAANEDLCDRYDVLRSFDGKSFESIGTKSCQRNALTNEYEFVDNSFSGLRMYYRIAQYDVDGSMTYSNIKLFQPQRSSAPVITLVGDFVEIKTFGEHELQRVVFTDALGKEIESVIPETNSSHAIKCPNIKSQLIIIKVVFNSSVYIKKVIFKE